MKRIIALCTTALFLIVALTGCNEETKTEIQYLQESGPTDPTIQLVNASMSGVMSVVPGQQDVEGAAFRFTFKDGVPRKMSQMVIETNSDLSGDQIFDRVILTDGTDKDIGSSYNVSYVPGKAKLTFNQPWAPQGDQMYGMFKIKFWVKPGAPKGAHFRLTFDGIQPVDIDDEFGGNPVVGPEFVIESQPGLELPIVTSTSSVTYSYLTPGIIYGGWNFEVYCPATSTTGCTMSFMDLDAFGSATYLTLVDQDDGSMSYSLQDVWDTSYTFQSPRYVAPGETKKYYFQAKASGTYLNILIRSMTFFVGGIKVSPVVGVPCMGGTSQTGVCLPVTFWVNDITPNGAPTTAWIEWANSMEDLTIGKGSRTPPEVFTDYTSWWTASSVIGLPPGTYYYRLVMQNVNGITYGPIMNRDVPDICTTPISGMLSCKG